MVSPHFRINEELTASYRAMPAAEKNLQIGRKLGEGLYSSSFDARINGRRVTLRLFKHLGPKDKMEFKNRNINKELDAIKLLEEAGVAETLFRSSQLRLRHIEATGPLKPTGPLETLKIDFWDHEPLKHPGTRNEDAAKIPTYVAYQICTAMPGQALSSIHKRRTDPKFVEDQARSFGKILAEFHAAAVDVALPHYDTPDELGKDDHSFRMVRNAPNLAEAFAKVDPGHAPHSALAKAIYVDVMPLFAEGAYALTRRSIHGDLGLGNMLVKGKHVSALIDFDKARKGFAEYDLMGIVVIPAMLNVVAAAYEARMKELTGETVVLDKGLALKLALAERLNRANLTDDDLKKLAMGKNTPLSEKRARGVVAIGIILDQLKYIDHRYAEHAHAFKPQLAKIRAKYPGIDHRVA